MADPASMDSPDRARRDAPPMRRVYRRCRNALSVLLGIRPYTGTDARFRIDLPALSSDRFAAPGRTSAIG
jgi:hypothetical protein